MSVKLMELREPRLEAREPLLEARDPRLLPEDTVSVLADRLKQKSHGMRKTYAAPTTTPGIWAVAPGKNRANRNAVGRFGASGENLLLISLE